MTRRLFKYVIACLFTLQAGLVNAHEFWISPSAYSISTSENLSVNLRNGEDFVGVFLPFYPPIIERFELHAAPGSVKLGRTPGDKPAAALKNLPEGLTVALYQSTTQNIKYEELAKFEKFAKAHDLSAAIADGNLKTPISEDYRRYSKMLIGVGSSQGSDKYRGMEFELVAITNPYFPAGRDSITFELLYQGKPMPDRQVELFDRKIGQTNGTPHDIYRTDASGRVKLPVQAGFEYLVNAVQIRPSPDVETWESLWASATFAIPEE